MRTLKTKLMGTGALLGLILGAGTPAQAQDNSDETKLKRLDEIVVTARKRSENIQDTPLAIDAFTSDMIESAGIRDISDVAKFTPGFAFDDEFGRVNSSRPVIRGQSTILGASGVSTFVDGILLNGSLLDYDLTDVERIEIVKGPQSALYGRNTYSGAINIITKSPSDKTSGEAMLDVGKFGRVELAGTVRGPVSDVLSASLHGRWFKRGGPFTNTFDNTKVGQQESLAGSLALYYEPTDKLSARARIRLSKLHDDQLRLFLTDPSENNVFFDQGGTYLGNGRYFEGEIVNHPIAYDDVRQLGQKGFDDVRSMQTSLSINYELNDQTSLEFINGFNTDTTESSFDFDHSARSQSPFAVYIGPVFPLFGPYFFHAYVIGDPADFASVGVSHSNDHSHELRLHYDAGQAKVLVGGYYYQGNGKFEGTRQAPPDLEALLQEGFAEQQARMVAQCAAHAGDAVAPCFSVPGFDSILNFGSDVTGLEFAADRSVIRDTRRNLAAFASVDFNISDQFAVTVEGRYKSERIRNRTNSRTAVFDYQGNQINYVEDPEVRREATFNSFNPRFTAKYRINDQSQFYAVIARGDKPGGFNNTNAAPIGFGTYDEEKEWSYEGGVKNTFMDGQLIFNVDGFYNSITNYQLTQAATLPGNQTTTVISNVGKVRVQGIEAELVYRVPSIPGLIINANYALADSKILKGTDLNEGRHLDVADDGRLNCSTGLQDPSLPCNSDNVLYGSIVGRQLPRSPKHSFSAGINYTRSVTDQMDIILNASISRESKKYVQVHNLAYVGANTLVNGSVTLQGQSGLSFTVWGRNLTNEDAVISAQRFIDPNQSFQRAFGGNPRLPRSWGATVRKKF